MTASLMPPEVMDGDQLRVEAVRAAQRAARRVGERIATLVKAEAAMVTSGAASAMTLGTAGVLTGGDAQKIVDLPNLAGMKTEVIMQKSHRFGYDHAVRNCGVKIVEVETAAELEAAITPQTAMMLFYNNNNSLGQIRDEEFVRLGKKHGVVTMNDCAADVPPVENLWKFTAMGFDLVAFSGGKGIRGPQSAGLLLGRKDLIAAARANAAPNGNTHRPRHEGQQGRDGGHAGRDRALREARSRGARPRVPRRADVILQEPRRPEGRHRQHHRARRSPTTCRTCRSSSTTAVTGITGQEVSTRAARGHAVDWRPPRRRAAGWRLDDAAR